MRLVSPMILLYTFESAFLKLQIWRLVTAMFFMGKFNFAFIFNIYFAYVAISKV